MAKAAKAKTLPDVAGLTKAQAKVEHKRLALELEGHDRRYYQDDAPEITDEMLARATLYRGDKVIRRGRPPLGERSKTAITLRLDADVVDAYRSTGTGWQSRINADLRRAQKLKKRA